MPPVRETRLPANAKEVTKITMKTAQTRNAIGAAVPGWATTTEGRAKIPAPMVELTMLAARLGTPSARIICLSSLGSIGALTRRRLRVAAARGKSLVVAGDRGDLPVNLHLIVEGEEEVGSDNLPIFMRANRDALKSDVALVSDTGMIAKGVPTLSYGLRGVTACEVKVTGSKMDLHSGVFGGAVANPITALARLLATLHDDKGHVAVEGLYDEVKPLEDWERKAWRELPLNGDEEIL